MDTHGIVEMMKEMANAKGGDDFKIIFIHDGMWFKMQMRNGCYSEERRPDTSGFSRKPVWKERAKYKRKWDTEALA